MTHSLYGSNYSFSNCSDLLHTYLRCFIYHELSVSTTTSNKKKNSHTNLQHSNEKGWHVAVLYLSPFACLAMCIAFFLPQESFAYFCKVPTNKDSLFRHFLRIWKLEYQCLAIIYAQYILQLQIRASLKQKCNCIIYADKISHHHHFRPCSFVSQATHFNAIFSAQKQQPAKTTTYFKLFFHANFLLHFSKYVTQLYWLLVPSYGNKLCNRPNLIFCSSHFYVCTKRPSSDFYMAFCVYNISWKKLKVAFWSFDVGRRRRRRSIKALVSRVKGSPFKHCVLDRLICSFLCHFLSVPNNV